MDDNAFETLPAPLETGAVLGGRFVVQELTARGGMGLVYRGVDTQTRSDVAIKVATPERPASVSRFAHEVNVLSCLSHPGIVRYIAGGNEGVAYLVMEWLRGETLAERLARESLSAEQALVMLRRTCEALSVAHAAGVVHRDLKPSNLFLVDGDVALLKLIDFGIARQRDRVHTLSQTGTVLGTLGYMSPEQAIGTRDVDARADVFALGCVLFECLTGRAAFTGSNAVAVLAKVLCEDPPPLRQARPDLSDQLGLLIARMLAKDVTQRPADATAVLEALDAMQPALAGAPTLLSRPSGLTTTERKIVAVILGRPRTASGDSDADTDPLETVTESSDASSLREIARRFGSEPMTLRGGAVMMVLSGRGAATDQTSAAARCALQLQRSRPDLRLCVATGSAETVGQIPIGRAIDRAAELLTTVAEPSNGIAIDELTAALLEQGFVVEREGGTFALCSERSEQQAARLLMGKPTPFVGRAKELGLLERTLSECIDDSVARVAIVVGAPGQGKSRLRYEFGANAAERSDVRVLMARADPVGAGSALLLVRQLVRRAIGLREGEPVRERHASLRAYVSKLLPGEGSSRLAEFLGELVGAPSPERPSPELRAARNDPQIMSVWLRRAFGEWLLAECTRKPQLLVLEDLHWGDAASVSYVGDALRSLADRPLMVLALARPEIHDTFPKLWANAEPQTINLGRLTPRAAERLVRVVLGDRFSPEAVARVVERADGNPFHLEELIRRVAEGDDRSLPETVLALVQSRLERLDPRARRLVRAASVFGETFWPGGIAEVLGTTAEAEDSAHWLTTLLGDELFASSRESRFAPEPEYRFRHGLLREAAYSMLTDFDRRSGHALAGQWLERVGEKDALTLANHYELGARPERAVSWLLAAAQAAADGSNVEDAIAIAGRGLALGAEEMERGCLHLVCAEANIMRARWHDVVTASRDAAALFEPGSSVWFKAAAGPLLAGTFLGDLQLTEQAVRTVASVPPRDEVTGPYGLSLFWVCQALLNASQMSTAEAIMQRAEALADSSPDVDPVFRMWLQIARSFTQMLRGDMRALETLAAARALAERTGAGFGRALSGMYSVAGFGQTGHVARTAQAAEAALAFSEPNGLHVASGWAKYFLALVYVRAATPAAELEARAIAPLRELCDWGDNRLAISARNILGLALLERGELEQAEREAKLANERARFPLEVATTLGVLAHVELALERPELALELAKRGLRAAEGGIFPWTGSMLFVSRARALHALGRIEEATRAITEARERVLRIADTLADPELRQSFLTNIDPNATTLELAQRWCSNA